MIEDWITVGQDIHTKHRLVSSSLRRVYMWADQKSGRPGFIWSSMQDNLALLHAVYKSTDQLVHLCSLVPRL